MTTAKKVLVSQVVTVTVDETKFTPEFYAEFRASMYPFDSLDEHIEHLAQLHARGIADGPNDFIEGYGRISHVLSLLSLCLIPVMLVVCWPARHWMASRIAG